MFRRDAIIVVPRPLCPSDSIPGRCDAAASTRASSTAECSWGAADDGDFDFDAAAVEEDALRAERTTNAHLLLYRRSSPFSCARAHDLNGYTSLSSRKYVFIFQARATICVRVRRVASNLSCMLQINNLQKRECIQIRL